MSAGAAVGGGSAGWGLPVDREALSGYLGFASIVTWLGAQSPQIYENFQRGSVEGLALPFLVSWFIGDFTNFIGCVLTHQLPFQTYLAGYFLLVDVVLCGQFAYYSRVHPVPSIPPFSEEYPYAQAHSPHSLAHHRHGSSRQSRSRSRKARHSGSRRPRRKTSQEDEQDEAEGGENLLAASWLTEGSANSSDVTASPRLGARRTTSSSFASEEVNSPATSIPPSPHERGRTLHRQAVRTFDPTLAPICGSPSSQGAMLPTYQSLEPSANHVSFSREPEEQIAPVPPPRQHGSGSRSNSRPAVSRRTSSSSAVVLSVGALMTLGRLASTGAAVAPLSADVITGASSALPNAWPTWWDVALRPPSDAYRRLDEQVHRSTKRSLTFPLEVSQPSSATAPHDFANLSSEAAASDISHVSLVAIEETPEHHRPHEPRKPDWERILGRTSAWTCTTAYLTSRLPQIWSNFRRRSVEGLAMTLFFFAFVGNSLYVASILTNPLASSAAYLLESLPYLLGSGGTLCFDLMILGQSWLYSEKRRARRAHERRRRAARGLDAEEAAALLHADPETEEDAAHSPVVPRRGNRSSREGKRSRKTSAESSLRSATRSRSTSTLGYGRSGSAGTRTGRPFPSMSRSNSTELADTHASSSRERRSLSRAERGHLADDPFEWDAATSSPYHSRRPSVEIVETIPEEGESSATPRA